VAKRIASLFRLLGSDFEGEVLGAVAAMKRLFTAEGLSFHDIATVVESCNGTIEERKYSDADAKVIYERGIEKGRAEGRAEQQLPPEFFDLNGQPRWSEIALFCQRNIARLRNAREKEFVNDMAGKMTWCEPTERQGKWLFAIFVKLGGRYDPQTTHC
jgi:hypothetical protein